MPPHGPMKAPAKPKDVKGTLKRLLGMMTEARYKLLIVCSILKAVLNLAVR